jgi:hypothetical protein
MDPAFLFLTEKRIVPVSGSLEERRMLLCEKY